MKRESPPVLSNSRELLPSVPFRYFRSSKIFILEAPYVGQKSAGAQLKRRIEYFWLCGGCSSAMALVANRDGSTRLVHANLFQLLVPQMCMHGVSRSSLLSRAGGGEAWT